MPAKKRPLLAVAISGSPAYNQPEKRRVTGAAVVSAAILPTGGSKLSTKICRLLPWWNITSRSLTLAEALGKACSTRRHNRCNIRDACKTSCAGPGQATLQQQQSPPNPAGLRLYRLPKCCTTGCTCPCCKHHPNHHKETHTLAVLPRRLVCPILFAYRHLMNTHKAKPSHAGHGS